MRSLLRPLTGGSLQARRRNVVVLAAALCLWMLASATHLHAFDEGVGSGEPSSACTYCLSLPTGGAAPASFDVRIAFEPAAALAPAYIDALISLAVPSSYLSRGPPAR